jgi:hypothetical protein
LQDTAIQPIEVRLLKWTGSYDTEHPGPWNYPLDSDPFLAESVARLRTTDNESIRLSELSPTFDVSFRIERVEDNSKAKAYKTLNLEWVCKYLTVYQWIILGASSVGGITIFIKNALDIIFSLKKLNEHANPQ